VRASFLGVGAPEAFVIAVVSLLVFGPKGLAEIAKNLGQTLRQFQPTIRELQSVSQEFKSALETEINRPDELKQTSSPPSPALDATLMEELEALRKASAAAAWGEQGLPQPAVGQPSGQNESPSSSTSAVPSLGGKLPDLSKLDE
jgi:TatA/E family protein of Tat protein translocase